MLRPLSAIRILALAFLLSLSACGGGGGGGGAGGGGNVFALNGAPVWGGVSPATGGIATYTFSATVDTAYTVTATTATGDAWLYVYMGDPNAGGTIIGFSWNDLNTTPLNTVSFIANTSGTVYVQVIDASFSMTGSTYSLQAYAGDLVIGTARSASTYNNSIYYSFDATSGTAYQVRLTPQSGNVNISSVNAKATASVGSSALTGTSMDTVTFIAPATQRYYVKVSPTSAYTTFNIQVVTTGTEPDLSVVVDSAVSDGANVTVNYTVRNQGLSTAGAFGVTGWAHSASAPTVGSTGSASSPSYASLAAGASVSGTFIIANTTASGTAYVIVDTANAVVETNEFNNVSAGKAWLKPLLAPQIFDFEDSQIPPSMTMSGNAGWVIETTTGGASTHSLKAGAIGNSQTSCTSMSVANGQSISFDYAVSSESSWDEFLFYIDGAQWWGWPGATSGTVNWTNTGAIPVSSGTHEYKWCYAKDFIGTAGSDTAWIDNIVVTQAGIDLQVVINSAVSNGANVTVNYTVSNPGTSTSGPFRVDAWSNSASAPLAGSTGEGFSTTYATLAAGATVTGSITIANAAANGTAYAIVDTQNSVIETDETNNVSLGQAWVAPPTVAAPVTYNFEDSLVPAAMAMSGNAAWVNAAGGAGASTRSLKAGTITHSQASCVAVNATSSSSASFDYSVDSESGWDFLEFYIDGVLNNSWAGIVAWTASGTIAAGATGTHEYKWCYTKDGSVSSGSDTAWIDNIVIN